MGEIDERGWRKPEFELRVWFSPNGYQADVMFDGEIISQTCRDWPGFPEDFEMFKRWLRHESLDMMERLRKSDLGRAG